MKYTHGQNIKNIPQLFCGFLLVSNNFIPHLSRHGQNKLFNICSFASIWHVKLLFYKVLFLTLYPFPRPRVISSILLIQLNIIGHMI